MNSLLIRMRAEGPARSLIDLCLRGIVVVIGSRTKGESPGVGGIKEATRLLKYLVRKIRCEGLSVAWDFQGR